jgi:lipopolysaccharide export system protein LptA
MKALEKLVFIWIFCFWSLGSFSQSKEKFEFVQSDYIDSAVDEQVPIKLYKGNVEFIRGEIYLYCDSLYYFSTNNLNGYGNVRVIKAGKKAYTLTGDQLKYDWKKNTLLMKGNVFLRYKNKEKRRKQIRFKLK